jgi:hypothetical protein
MKRFLISAYYSDWVIAGSKEEAVDIVSDRIIDGDIKMREWDINVQEMDEDYTEVEIDQRKVS